MSVSIVRPENVSTEDVQLVQLHIFVVREDWEGDFDQIEVWRSRTSSSGPYDELTADRWRYPRIPASAGDQPATPVTGREVVVVGETLSLQLNERDDLTVVLTGVDPLTLAESAAQIVTAGATRLRSYIDEDGILVVESTEPGTGAALRVVGGDAAPILGLPTTEPDSVAYGRDPRITLVQGQEEYLFTDIRGAEGYFYKTRFRNASSGTFSEFSQPFPVGQALGVSASNVVCGRLDLVQSDGKPLQNAEVQVYSSYRGQLVEEKLVAGPQQNKLTDRAGRAEFFLVRGMQMTVVIMGTDITREVSVPTDESIKVFNLLDPSVSVEDVFTVQVPRIVTAERRSL